MLANRRSLLALASLVVVAGGCSGGAATPADGGAGRPGSDGGVGGIGGGGGETPPPVACPTPVSPADVTQPKTVVGTGAPASCTEGAFDSALAAGGVITFNCGPAPATITVTAEKVIRGDTVIDGGGTVTLSGGKGTRILAIRSAPELQTPALTVQNLTFVDGSASDVPNTRDLKGGGGAIFRLGGRLTIINSRFFDNRCAQSGQDVAGGAIFSQGGGDTVVVGSQFARNSGSNGGALGHLASGLVLINTTITDNAATGSGGNPGNGGNGGGVNMDGEGRTLAICGSSISRNRATAHGGGLFRTSYRGEPTIIERSTFDGNVIPDRQPPSLAGGLYLQGTVVTMSHSTISNNAASGGGGLFVATMGRTEINLTNVTVAGNRAISALGGGVYLNPGVRGQWLNVTVAHNEAPGALAFGGGVVGGTVEVRLTNTIVANNRAGNEYNPINCTSKMAGGGGNIQFPVQRTGGGSDDPGALCTDGALIADPLLDPLTDNGGPTATVAVRAGSPAIGRGAGCPPTDQRGRPRGSPCTVGAFDVE